MDGEPPTIVDLKVADEICDNLHDRAMVAQLITNHRVGFTAKVVAEKLELERRVKELEKTA